METTKPRKPWLAALLSWFIPGMGHYYAGNSLSQAAVFTLLFWVILILFRSFASSFLLFLTFFLIAIMYMIGLMISAYRLAKQQRMLPEPIGKRPLVYLLFILVQFIGASTLVMAQNSPLPIQLFSIPTTSMSPALKVGDKIVGKKSKVIERGDIVIFEKPPELETLSVKRAIGMPSDSLQLIGGEIFINGKPLHQDFVLQYSYAVQVEDNRRFLNQLEELGITEFDLGIRTTPSVYRINTTPEQATKLAKKKGVLKLEILSKPAEKFDPMVFPHHEAFKWNIDNYGPIYIPQKGATIPLNTATFILYKTYMEAELGKSVVSIQDSLVFIDNAQVDSYTFQKDYYFMIGDNRHNTLDGRFWGLLPEDLIFGHALYIYWSEEKSRIGTYFTEKP